MWALRSYIKNYIKYKKYLSYSKVIIFHQFTISVFFIVVNRMGLLLVCMTASKKEHLMHIYRPGYNYFSARTDCPVEAMLRRTR